MIIRKLIKKARLLRKSCIQRWKLTWVLKETQKQIDQKTMWKNFHVGSQRMSQWSLIHSPPPWCRGGTVRPRLIETKCSYREVSRGKKVEKDKNCRHYLHETYR